MIASARRLGRPNVAAVALPIALAFACAGCDDGPGEPTAVARPPAEAPAVDAVLGGSTEPAADPTLIAAGPPIALSVRAMNPVRRPDLAAADLRPGRWSPDGGALVAWQVVDRAATVLAGRAWLVAAPADDGTGQAPLPSPVWDSGDIEGPLEPGLEHLAVWLADGTLAVARSDEMLITADGLPGPPVAGLGERQLRGLLPAPDGTRLLAYGPAGAWIVAADGRAEAVAESAAASSARAAEGLGAWTWRPDGGALAAAGGAEILVADLLTGGPLAIVARVDAVGGDPVADAASTPEGSADQPAMPRWLADGTLFLGGPSPLAGGRPDYLYRAIHADGTIAFALPEQLGRDPSPVPVAGASAWVAPDGRAILYPEVVAGPDGPAVRASWLYDVATGQARALPPMVDAVWSPDGGRVAWSEAGAVLVRDLDSDRVAVLASAGAAGSARFAWSPDGRWLLFGGALGDLWLARADATAGTVRVAEDVAWEPLGPTWSPSSDRFALAVRGPDGGTRFIVAELPAE